MSHDAKKKPLKTPEEKRKEKLDKKRHPQEAVKEVPKPKGKNK